MGKDIVAPSTPLAPSSSHDRSRIDVALFIAVVPIVAAAVRIWLFSGGDVPVFLTLLRTIDIPAVLIGTIVLMIPGLITLALAILLTDWKMRDRAKAWLNNRRWLTPLAPVVIFVLLYTVSWAFVISLVGIGLMVAAYVLIRRFWPWGKKHIADVVVARRGDENGPVSLVTFVGVLIAFLIMPTSTWLPLERIDVNNSESRTAYVLESTGEWTTLLTLRHKIEVHPTNQIKNRAVCRAEANGSLATLMYRTNDRNDAPDCRQH